MNKIHYAFGRDYLKSWTIKDALREVFQNYIDYGHYDVGTKPTGNPDVICVTIANNYNPNNLEFLRLGNTSKDDGKSIGHHGEGLKAAFLIFTREDLFFDVRTPKYRLIGAFQQEAAIGETFHITYTDMYERSIGFVTQFHCPKDIYEEFLSGIITKNDVLYDDECYGQLLKDHKGKGNIYSGGLFVCTIDDLNYSYNIKPEHLALDRDRRAPSDWDVDWSTSKIFEKYKKSIDIPTPTGVSYNSRDYKHTTVLTATDIASIKSITIDNKIQYYDTINSEVINNSSVKNVLNNHPKFKKNITLNRKEKFNRAKKANRRKSSITLLRSFKSKYCTGNEDMSVDIDVILDKLNIK